MIPARSFRQPIVGGPTLVGMSSGRVPLVASVFALSAGLVWSFGGVTARSADHSDAFQYLIWRSVGIIVVIELIARWRRRPAVTKRLAMSRSRRL